ncbi:MAG: hypothetical protein ACQER7_14820 [Bacteroidota bacterium]
MKNKVKLRWYVVVSAVILLTVVTFTPLVTPVGQYKPELFGFPYTLWAGIVVGILLVLLTIYGSTIAPGSKKWEESQ